MLIIVTCDDSWAFLKLIQEKLTHYFSKKHLNIAHRIFSDSNTAIRYCLKNTVDLVLLDVEMPGKNGMEMANILNQKKPHLPIAFVTSHEELVFEAIRCRPFGFIRKSCLDEDLEDLVKRFLQWIQKRNQKILLDAEGKQVSVSIPQILYVESAKNYIMVHTAKNIYKIRKTINQFEKEVGRYGLIRCHKGFLVNYAHIEEISKHELFLTGEVSVPLSRTYTSSVKDAFMQFSRR